jgi:hypothetical protein
MRSLYPNLAREAELLLAIEERRVVCGYEFGLAAAGFAIAALLEQLRLYSIVWARDFSPCQSASKWILS